MDARSISISTTLKQLVLKGTCIKTLAANLSLAFASMQTFAFILGSFRASAGCPRFCGSLSDWSSEAGFVDEAG